MNFQLLSNSELGRSLFASFPKAKIDSGDLYFTEEVFEKILDKCKREGYAVFGIEAWIDRTMDRCEVYETYDLPPDSPEWYQKAFDKLRIGEGEKIFLGTFGK